MSHLRFLKKAMQMTLSTEMMYKLNFFLRMITLLSFDLILPLVTMIIYLSTDGFPGWTLNEIILFNGIFIFINGLDRLFFQQVDWTLSHMVKSGNFDRVLLYPVNTLAYLSFHNFRPEHLSNLLVGVVFIAYSFIKIPIVLSLNSALLFILYFVLALMLVYSMAVLRFALIIKAIEIGRIGELFRTIRSYAEYPVDIFSRFISSGLRYLLPLAVIAYYPSRVLLEKSTEFTPMISVVLLFIISEILWRISLKYYTSAGG